MRVMFYK